MPLPIIAIVGPTASGKTSRAVAVAQRCRGEIVSADSRQVYRGMDIGSGKDICEYADVPYHLIDVAEAGTKYNLYMYLRDASKAIAEINQRGNRVVVCGGSGMYVESLLAGKILPEVPPNPRLREHLKGESIDTLAAILAGYKKLHNVTDLDTPSRAIRAIEIQEYYKTHPEEEQLAVTGTPPAAHIFGVDIDREVRRSRISARLRTRLDEGMVEEVKRLLDDGVDADTLIGYGLEYKFLTLHLQGILSYDEMFTGLETAIHQFAKRQMTWFRGMERRGLPIHWISATLSDNEYAEEVLNIVAQQEISHT